MTQPTQPNHPPAPHQGSTHPGKPPPAPTPTPDPEDAEPKGTPTSDRHATETNPHK